MFETESAREFPRRPLILSAVLHAAGVLLVCFASFPVAQRPAYRFRSVLIAPIADRPVIRIHKNILRPRKFAAPQARAAETSPKPAIPPPEPAPVILEPVRASIPEFPPSVPAVTPAPTVPIPAVRSASFEAVEQAPVTRPKDSPTGADVFSTASANTAEVHSRGAVRASGFDSAREITPKETLRETAGAKFGDVVVAAPARRTASISGTSQLGSSATTAVEILEKPRPEYTDDARRLRIEGEVLLDVRFEASGQARVLRVVQGLGHGLNERAAEAARRIRFRPAARDGVPVDSSAVIHIVFQLAY